MNKSTQKIESIHKSVLPAESIDFLDVKKSGVYVDSTLGLGGHTEKILSSGGEIRVIGIDQDAEAIEFARERLAKFGSRFSVVQSNFSDIETVLEIEGIEKVDGIIADLGVSSLQFDSETRGFSFRFDAPLDMRMDAESNGETAAELLKRLSQEDIANVIYEFGEERFSRRIARLIVLNRKDGKPVETTKELAELVKRAVPRKKGGDKIHPATKTFQALRIAVNNELGILEEFIRDSVKLLKIDGRLVVITFHSLEDRIVKRTLQKLSGKCFCPPKFPKCVCGKKKTVKILTRKPIVPTDEERNENPRSRSAKLRACSKL